MLVLGVGFKKAVVDPLIRHGVIPLVIATLGLSIGVKNLGRASYSAEAHPFPNVFPDTLVSVLGVRNSFYDIGTLVLAGAIVFGLQGFPNRTLTGRALQGGGDETRFPPRVRGGV